MSNETWERTQSACPLNIIIIGAGLGGLAAAIQCTLAGHRVTILEQAVEIGEIGAGIQVPPQSARLLKKWGIADKVAANAVTPSGFRLHDYKGKILSESPVNPYVVEKYGNPYFVIHRADYHKVLLDKALSLGVKMRLGSVVEGVDFKGPKAFLKGGAVVGADLIMGCDGLKSKVRELIVGHPDPPVNTGDLAYRILIPASEMRKHKELHFLLEGGSKAPLSYWMGPGAHVVCYLLRGGNTYNIVLISPDNLPKESNIAAGTIEEMKALFEKWDPRLKILLSLVDKPPTKWRLQNHPEMATWVHTSGKVALLGDACHPTLPYLASGAAIAIEDGAVLGLLLAKIKSKDDLPHILRVYEKIRKARTTTVVQRSSHYQTIFHAHDGPEQEARDKLFAEQYSNPQEGYPNQWADPVFQKWLWGYKPEEEVERSWAEYNVMPPHFGRHQFNAKL